MQNIDDSLLDDSLLVLGCGNTLRGDDAVGFLIAEAVAAWGLPGVSARAVQQWTLELAEDVAASGRVVFVDARADRENDPVDVRPIVAVAAVATLEHAASPGSLLAMAEAVFGRAPAAWLVTVPASGFEFGAQLSPRAEAGMAEALGAIRQIIAA